ncbi:MAG: nucleotide pyrophosphatase/phosphodiesterase family protein, partial [Verrucomicrobiota bacterium]
CVTFPAHTTLATGQLPGKHGITADTIRTAPGTFVTEPTDPSLMLVEPIWTTATRQGIKTLVHDWPLSQQQPAENPAAYYRDTYDGASDDSTRLNFALEQWRASATAAADDDTQKLRLVMVRLNDILSAGLLNGPRTEETYEAVAATDSALKTFFDTVQAEWETLAPANANLVVLISTDHGLAELKKNVNLPDLLGEELMANAEVVAHNGVANLWFKDLPESEIDRNLLIEKFDDVVSKFIYFRTYKKEDLPADWEYNHSDRVGDRVMTLKTDYGFTDMSAEEPVFDPTEGPGYFGGYGYPVNESIRMSGQIILAGYPNPVARGDFGEIGQTEFHATVCKLLGIEPAAGANPTTLELR